MKNKLIYSIAASALLLAATAQAQVTINDPLTSADANWTFSGTSISYSAAGAAITGGYDTFTLASALGGNSTGDFSLTVNFTGFNPTAGNQRFGIFAGLASGAQDQILLATPISYPTNYYSAFLQNVGSSGNLTVTTNVALTTSGSLTINQVGDVTTTIFSDGTDTRSLSLTNSSPSSLATIYLVAPDGPVTFSDFSLTATATPEPGTLALAALGGVGSLLAYRRRK